MKDSILKRIQALGGNIENINGDSLMDIIPQITFNTVLYKRPEDTPWAKAEDQEPIYGLGEFVDNNMDLFEKDKEAFYNKMLETFYILTDKAHGQTFWLGEPFTPFKEGSDDFEEWNDDFNNDKMVDLTEVIKVTNNSKPDFINIFEASDNIYIATDDPNPENPTLFGTDHEVFFREISNMGNLDDYLNNFMTKEEFLEIVKNKLEM